MNKAMNILILVFTCHFATQAMEWKPEQSFDEEQYKNEVAEVFRLEALLKQTLEEEVVDKSSVEDSSLNASKIMAQVDELLKNAGIGAEEYDAPKFFIESTKHENALQKIRPMPQSKQFNKRMKSIVKLFKKKEISVDPLAAKYLAICTFNEPKENCKTFIKAIVCEAQARNIETINPWDCLSAVKSRMGMEIKYDLKKSKQNFNKKFSQVYQEIAELKLQGAKTQIQRDENTAKLDKLIKYNEQKESEKANKSSWRNSLPSPSTIAVVSGTAFCLYKLKQVEDITVDYEKTKEALIKAQEQIAELSAKATENMPELPSKNDNSRCLIM